MSEASLPKIGYFHGRFQPFHLGHAYVVQEALKSVDKLIIGLSNPFRQPAVLDEAIRKDSAAAEVINSKTRVPENNPWPMWARELMITEGLDSLGVDTGRIMFVPNLSNSGISTTEVVPPSELVTIFIVGKEAHNKVKEQQYIDEGYNIVALDEYEFGGSGSEIRRRIRANEPWEKLIPKGTTRIIKELAKVGIGI
jgi:cytidyltransferase-like protein